MNITDIANMLKDKAKTQKLGEDILKRILQALVKEKLNVKPDDPDLRITFRRGEPVPVQFQDEVPVDSEGKALRNAEIRYVIYDDIWRLIWKDYDPPAGFRGSLPPKDSITELNLKNVFSDEELKVLKKLGIL